MPSTHAPSPAQPRWLPPSPEPTGVSTGTHSRALEAGRSSSREPQVSQSHSAASAERRVKKVGEPRPQAATSQQPCACDTLGCKKEQRIRWPGPPNPRSFQPTPASHHRPPQVQGKPQSAPLCTLTLASGLSQPDISPASQTSSGWAT